AFVHASATAVWPPTGIALAALLVYGYSVWPAVFVGAFLVNVTTAGTVASSLGIAAGNTLEALVGVWLVNRWVGRRQAFARARSFFAFAALAGGVATAVSATVGVASLALAGHAGRAWVGAMWRPWWVGDMAGALLLTPVLFLWAMDRRLPRTRAAVLERALVLASVVLVGAVVFGGLGPAWLAGYPLEFLCIPPLV